MVSVDVKHHVYLFSRLALLPPSRRSAGVTRANLWLTPFSGVAVLQRSDENSCCECDV